MGKGEGTMYVVVNGFDVGYCLDQDNLNIVLGLFLVGNVNKICPIRL